MREWIVYLAGEIHSNWRQEIIERCEREKLPIEFSSPVTDHDASDNCGVSILGEEDKSFWKDYKGASINSIRTQTLIDDADILVVRFGEKYRQWNAAFDAGYAAASRTPIITLHDDEHVHALKEINAAACASARTPEQVVEILKYVIMQR
jgi:YtoQ family protein